MPIKFTMLVSLIAAIFLLIAVIYFVIQVPRALSQDSNNDEIKFFIGQKTWKGAEMEGVFESEHTWTWFPHIGFFFALTTSIINFHAVIGMHKNKRSYTYIPKERGDLLYQQKQNHLPEGLITQPQIQPPKQQPQSQIPQQPKLAEFKAVIEGVIDEKRIEEIHQERLKILKDIKAESDLDDMLDDYNSTKTKIEEEEEAIERELSKIASKFDFSDLVDSENNKSKKNMCPKCDGELKSKNGIFKCLKCGSKFRQK